MKAEILVIGALGNVGCEVVKELQAKGISVRAADLFPEKINERFGAGVEAVGFDFAKPETYQAAFHGIKKMFLLRPPQITDIQKMMVPALEAAKAAGVIHIVFLSLIGIESNTVVPHYKVELWLRASGLSYTFLRASFFMQNLNTVHRAEIRDLDIIEVPVGSAKTSFLDTRDIGAVAAVALTETGHENQAYDLTGSEALDYYQVAEQFSEVLGRKITYTNPSPIKFFIRLVQRGTKIIFAVIQTWLYNNTRKGMADTVTGEVKRLLGRDPIKLKQYIEDYKLNWKKD
ncbi:MAG: NAD(P)-dependent oxidoreductase [Anaerolineaceae bacterium]|nr:NAD(P)-dependent oxidoreductase [Anaerolineaceae bacterium]